MTTKECRALRIGDRVVFDKDAGGRVIAANKQAVSIAWDDNTQGAIDCRDADLLERDSAVSPSVESQEL